MAERPVAIVDYGMGNLFSVQAACRQEGLETVVTRDPAVVRAAPGIILPGVGAMPDAIAVLEETGLAGAMRDAIARDVPFLGICLGLQLLMTEGTEFRPHRGLGVIPGIVRRIEGRDSAGAPLRVPHIGWNALRPADAGSWTDTPLARLSPGELMYFVHSFHAVPDDPSLVAAWVDYGDQRLCAAIRHRSVFACQFHPERSGPRGLAILRAYADRVHAHADRA